MEFDDDYDYDFDDLRPSKSALKREAHRGFEIGERLCGISAGTLKRLTLPEDVASALKLARSMPHDGARKRQLQFLGRLLRKEDMDPIEDILDRIEQGLPLQDSPVVAPPAPIPAWKEWAQRLVTDGNPALEELIRLKPDTVERSRLRQLIRNYQKKPEAEKPRVALEQYVRDVLK